MATWNGLKPPAKQLKVGCRAQKTGASEPIRIEFWLSGEVRLGVKSRKYNQILSTAICATCFVGHTLLLQKFCKHFLEVM